VRKGYADIRRIFAESMTVAGPNSWNTFGKQASRVPFLHESRSAQLPGGPAVTGLNIADGVSDYHYPPDVHTLLETIFFSNLETSSSAKVQTVHVTWEHQFRGNVVAPSWTMRVPAAPLLVEENKLKTQSSGHH